MCNASVTNKSRSQNISFANDFYVLDSKIGTRSDGFLKRLKAYCASLFNFLTSIFLTHYPKIIP